MFKQDPHRSRAISLHQSFYYKLLIYQIFEKLSFKKHNLEAARPKAQMLKQIPIYSEGSCSLWSKWEGLIQ